MHIHRLPGTCGRTLALLLAGGSLAACATLGTPTVKPQDQKAMIQATQKALEKNRIGVSANWQSAETGHRGTVTPLRTFPSRSRPCREYQMTFTAEGSTEFDYRTACRWPDGSWRAAGGAHLAGSRFEGRAYGYPDPPYYRCDPFYDPYWCRDPFWPHYPYGFGFHHYRRFR